MIDNGRRGTENARAGRGELWRVVGLAMGPLVAVGLARFAYGLLLPPMREQLGLSYTEAGTLNTVNAVGYLLGAVAATWLVRVLGRRRVFLAGLVFTAVALLGCAATTSLVGLAVLRLGAGIAGAVAFVAGASLAAHAGAHLRPGRAAALLGIYVAGGAGAGTVLSGLGIPLLLAHVAPTWGWRDGWLLLGVLSLAAVVPAALASRRVPPAAVPPDARRSWDRRRLAATAGAYLLFGVGYIGYVTFVIAVLGAVLDPLQVAAFWVLLGISALATCASWGPLLGRARGARGLALLLAVAALGAVLPVVVSGPVAAFGSAVLFGCAFLSTVTAVTVVARRSLAPHQWGPAIGGLTVAFAVGQCVGPVLSGFVSDLAGSGVRAGLAVSALVLALGTVLALAQPATDTSRAIGISKAYPVRRLEE